MREDDDADDDEGTGVSHLEAALEVSELSMTYGSGAKSLQAIERIDLSVRAGEFMCIVGPSGAGKTTLLKCLSGLLKPTSGTIKVGGSEVIGPPRGLAMVFQEYTRSLLPWLTVEKNVDFPLASTELSRDERLARRSEALEAVGLLGFEQRYPWELSGGMQQRAAIARAIAYEPQVLIMDEPFASVDAQTRADLEDLILGIRRSTGVTVVLVTHDIDESVYLGDRIVVLSQRPTTVREVIAVPLGANRSQVDTKADPEFVALRTRILTLIQKERETER